MTNPDGTAAQRLVVANSIQPLVTYVADPHSPLLILDYQATADFQASLLSGFTDASLR